jgi:2-polyprenyl-6-methoxyphenol hydroxylase-like FAD-dependent oxidoreductase
MRRAIIVGGGVAGPATPKAHAQVGIGAAVFEAHPRSDGHTGSYFTITPNGLDALDALGALDIAKQIGFASRRNVMVGGHGSILGTVPLGLPLPDGTVALTMKRSRLALALTEEAERRGIAVHHERRLVDATVLPEGRVRAVMHDGSSVEADLLVGADGVHSVVRRLVDPKAPDGRYVGLTNFGGITDAGIVDVDAGPGEWRFVFGRRAFFGYHLTAGGDVVWFVNSPRPEISRAERTGTTSQQWQLELAALFSEDHAPAADLILRGRLELQADNTYDLPRVPVWHRGAMVVIGDAAHAPAPSSGQGASMALEDAVVLAGSLRDAAAVEDGLAAYESRRRGRVERIVRYGARSSSSKTAGPVGAVVRDTMLRLVFRALVTERSLEWMYGHRVDRQELSGSRSALS